MKSAISLMVSLLALFFASQFSNAGEKADVWTAQVLPIDVVQVNQIIPVDREPGSTLLLRN